MSELPERLYNAPTVEQVQAAGEQHKKYKKEIVGERIIYWYLVDIRGNCNCK